MGKSFLGLAVRIVVQDDLDGACLQRIHAGTLPSPIGGGVLQNVLGRYGRPAFVIESAQ